MPDIKLHLPSLKKDILVEAPGKTAAVFNEVAAFVFGLEERGQIRDLEQGINPKGATHEVVKDEKGDYRLKRFRFSGIG
jgi:hypothetical protein